MVLFSTDNTSLTAIHKQFSIAFRDGACVMHISSKKIFLMQFSIAKNDYQYALKTQQEKYEFHRVLS